MIGRRQSSPELSALASRYMTLSVEGLMDRVSHDDGYVSRDKSTLVMSDIRRLAASVLSQDETP